MGSDYSSARWVCRWFNELSLVSWGRFLQIGLVRL
jgi:hypothetical protein